MLKLDGEALARQIEPTHAARVARVKERLGGVAPTLATILVGDDAASAHYVRKKIDACARIGMGSIARTLRRETSEAELLGEIAALNADSRVHGILLQHPVPAHINERRCFDAIAKEKDVDGVTSGGFGRMAMGEPAFGSATPTGIMHLLRHYGIDVAGKHAVVAGRSAILGKPLAMMLLNANATVTICHSHTQGLDARVAEGDIVIGALGRPEFIKGAWIKAGAVVVDAGYNPGDIGDVELSVAMTRCSAYTPVPGGVGPMTISSLLKHTIDAAERAVD